MWRTWASSSERARAGGARPGTSIRAAAGAVGNQVDDPCALADPQDGLERGAVRRDRVRQQVGDTVREHGPGEIDRLAACAAERNLSLTTCPRRTYSAS